MILSSASEAAAKKAWRLLFLFIKKYVPFAVALLILSGCGTFTPIPSQGGGKRYAIEQALTSAVIRAALSELPLEKLRNKKVNVTLSIIADEGGGVINGGRAQFTSTALATLSSAAQSNWAGAVNIGSQRGDLNYAKDNIYAVSDHSYLTNLLLSLLKRNNISVVANQVEATYELDLLVDVLGIIRDRTDWVAINSENLAAMISLETTLTPHYKDGQRIVSRNSFQASYKEEYALWTGPLARKISIEKINLEQIYGIFVPIYDETVKLDVSSQFVRQKNEDVKAGPYIPRPTGRSR